MAKKRYNARARTNPTVEIDNSSVNKVINKFSKLIIDLFNIFFTYCTEFS